MATVNIDVLARVQKRAIDRATDDLNRGFARAGSDAGKQFATNFSDRIEASGDMARAFDDSTAATRRLRDAQDKLNAAYRSVHGGAPSFEWTRLSQARNCGRYVVRAVRVRGQFQPLGEARS